MKHISVLARRSAFILIVALLAMSVSPVLADHEDDPFVSDIVLTIPETYGSCVDMAIEDTITTSGVGARYLQGQVFIDFVTDAGRVPVPGGFYPVAQTGDLNLTITIPPVSEWPVQSNGTAEIHVDVQVEVYDKQGGVKLGLLGPGHDYDVFCLTPPPPPPPGGIEGCTPGFWKQDQHFDSWTGYSPTDLFDSVFGVDANGNLTLAQAAAQGGRGESALMRHAVAALLNAASADVDYAFTTSEVIQIVQDAYASGGFEGAKNTFETENEKGCPLS